MSDHPRRRSPLLTALLAPLCLLALLRPAPAQAPPPPTFTYPNWTVDYGSPQAMSDGTERLLWFQQDSSTGDLTGGLTIWSLSATGATPTSSPVYNPGPNWQSNPYDFYPDANDAGGILEWDGVDPNNYDAATGSYAFWKIGTNGSYNGTSVSYSESGWRVFDGLQFTTGGTPYLWWTQVGSDGYTPTGAYALWTLDPNTLAIKTYQSYSAPGWSTDGPEQRPDGNFYIWWTQTGSSGTYALWLVNPTSLAVTASQSYTASGWRAELLTETNSTQYLFWTQINSNSADTGTYAFWFLNSTSLAVTTTSSSLSASGWLASLHSTVSGSPLLFWRAVDSNGNATGSYSLWFLTSAGNYSSSNVYTASGWKADLLDRPDGTLFLWWTQVGSDGETPTGYYTDWMLKSDGSVGNRAGLFAPGPSWLLSGPWWDSQDNTVQLFWHQVDSNSDDTGSYSIWNLDASGNYSSSNTLSAPGWQAQPVVNGYSRPAKIPQLFWTQYDSGLPTGAVAFWNLNSSGANISSEDYTYGPY